ncbi:PEP/pyruvate-binding domain-containing protein [Arthrobacter sp. B3I4]|uniref:PEP/pyruvate-binding domain-containing protein n=1 Tax=Arthrobacter sp. B3I4 TaxID=3042267 RepID=UPI00278028DF|nr:PEP/pyruvate-binding domain-containing protein [Arthrobacter sp. B3I4]MDQ0754415.1 phosphohistidine swiveling domain-containing protein [Arthrobacter sp. B3I4]
MHTEQDHSAPAGGGKDSSEPDTHLTGGDGVDGFILDLAQAGSAPLRLVGGKALNLGKLTAAGLPVPAGFCLTTDAYRLSAPTGLQALAARLDGVTAGASDGGTFDVGASDAGATAAELDGLPARARALIGAAAVPPAVEAALRSAYAALGAEPAVAVRSSATAEDLPFASFAGQQDSYLDITGADAVVDAVRRCWASLWSDRAVAYRSANGVSHRDVGLAVIVQVMVDAATAGVMFTANPVTGTRTETVVNASPGAGQAVVSGAVNPDQFTLATASAAVLRRVPGDDDPERWWSLDDPELARLTRLGDAAQRLFGTPQDVEWVLDASDKVWLTQSRPITSLYPLEDPFSPGTPAIGGDPDGDPDGGKGTRVYLCGTLLQGLTRPITPMGLVALSKARNDKGPWQYANPGLRMFVDLTAMTQNKWGRRYLTQMLPLADGRSAALVPELLADPRFAVRKHTHTIPGATPHKPRLRKPGKEAAASLRMVLGLIPAMLGAALRPEAELRRAEAYGQRLEADLVLPEPATARQRLDYSERLLRRTIDGLIQATLPGPSVGYIMLAVARRLLRGIAAPRELEAVLRGLPHNVTTEMDLELWHLAVDIGADQASRDAFLAREPADLAAAYRAGLLPAVGQEGVQAFLARYGHRAVAEIDLGMPRWSEQPDHILGMITNYLRVEDPEQAPEQQFRRAAEHAEERIRSLVAQAGTRGRWRARALELCLRRVRQLSGLRELPKFHIVTILGEMHRQLLLVGAELVRAGVIVDAEDVFFLDFDELRVALRGARMHPLVASRRRLYDVELRRRHIPRVLLSDGTDLEAAVMAKAPPYGALSGTPASAGTATGRVRVITDPVGARLEPGEILVAPSTDPGWTPLFLTAGALVMEMGGVISHGAVVAREYGIPAVVGVPDATTRLRTGQSVTVDGAAGTVRELPD